jgi:hypothetical protein
MEKDEVVYSTLEKEKEREREEEKRREEELSMSGLWKNKDGEWEIDPWLL